MDQRISQRCPLYALIFLLITLSTFSLVLQSCGGQATVQTQLATEPFRPAFHFTPAQDWMNDPNGLVYLDGEYHLFYQYNPDATVWGPMHWGHAISTDLVNWQRLPVVLSPDSLGNIFSGSAVVDKNNTAGFGANAMVAIFTHEQQGAQRQSLAYSTDKGRTWSKYAGNPVLKAPNNLKNFRDPKVFWYSQAGGGGHWFMLLAAGSVILFYTSPDLKNWTSSGGFGFGYGSTAGVWETPDLFELPLDGGPATRWVLSVGVGSGAPAGGSGIQYFIGSFDGNTFTSENPKNIILWADRGADFYAAQSWNDVPGNRRIWAAWMNNWTYAQQIPTPGWRGALTLPRQLALATTPQGIRLVQQPLTELQHLRGQPTSWQNQTISPGANLLNGVTGETLEIAAEFQVNATSTADRFGFRLRTGKDETTVIGYNTKSRTLFVDRSHSGQVAFNPAFQGIHTAQMDPVAEAVRLRIFVDSSSVEVFGNDGAVVITDQIFPSDQSVGLELFTDGGQILLKSLEVYPLEPASIQ
ncbi:MAG TPA: glycoside hydrolase family 32 protein [Anaerolineaceae bacterium]|nr:glycoside hydrolase family 32 protein [Anaerolineaceae bacterium]